MRLGWLFFVMLGVLGGVVRADPIESEVVENPWVLRVRVERVTPVPTSALPDAVMLDCTTLETLKEVAGHPLGTFRALYIASPSVGQAEALGAKHTELLVMLREDSEGPGGAPGKSLVLEAAYILGNSPGKPPEDFLAATDLHFNTLLSPEAILAAARKQVARGPTPMMTLGSVGNLPAISLPNDDRLPELVSEWSTSLNPRARLAAAEALEFMPASAGNLAMAKSLLADRYSEMPTTDFSPWSVKFFPIRLAAARTLMNVQHLNHFESDAVFWEPAELYQPVHIYVYLGAGLAVVVVIFIGRYSIRRRFGLGKPSLLNRLFVLPAVVLLLMSLVAGFSWVRSYRVGDDFYDHLGKDLMNVTSCRGGLRFQIIYGADRTSHLVHFAAMPDAEPSDMMFSWRPMFHNHFGSNFGWGDRLDNPSGFFFAADYPLARFEEAEDPSMPPPPYRTTLLVLPYRYLLLGTAWLPAVFFGGVGISVWRRKRRERAGYCPVCHYDLRGQGAAANPSRCPECGTAIARDAGGV